MLQRLKRFCLQRITKEVRQETYASWNTYKYIFQIYVEKHAYKYFVLLFTLKCITYITLKELLSYTGRDNTVVTMASNVISAQSAMLFCPKHPTEEMDMYCHRCKKATYTKCMAGDHCKKSQRRHHIAIKSKVDK